MLQITDLSLSFGTDTLFKDGNIVFNPGNCYGIIGANGAGKTTLLRILSGEIEPSGGTVSRSPNERISVLKQDHNAYNEYSVIDAIIMGNPRLYEIQKEKDALYAKEDFSEEDGIKAGELESEYAEMGGYEADAEAGKLLMGLGL